MPSSEEGTLEEGGATESFPWMLPSGDSPSSNSLPPEVSTKRRNFLPGDICKFPMISHQANQHCNSFLAARNPKAKARTFSRSPQRWFPKRQQHLETFGTHSI
ncbi:unnamed protein product [Natator depressus]